MKKITAILLMATIVIFIYLVILPEKSFAKTDESNNKINLNIITSNKAEYYMVKLIVADKHNVNYLNSNQNELMSFNTSNGKEIDYKHLDLFFHVGKDYEPWVDQFIENIDKRKTGIIDISRGISNINNKIGNKGTNPYYWTGLEEYFVQLFNIKSTIEEKDPKNRWYYEKKYKQAVDEIQSRVDNIVNHKIDKGYTFISIDDKLDCFYDDLNIDVIKSDKKDLDSYINKNHIDTNKIVILKDRDTQFTKEGLKIVNLQGKNDDLSIEQLILNNYQEIYSLFQ